MAKSPNCAACTHAQLHVNFQIRKLQLILSIAPSLLLLQLITETVNNYCSSHFFFPEQINYSYYCAGWKHGVVNVPIEIVSPLKLWAAV